MELILSKVAKKQQQQQQNSNLTKQTSSQIFINSFTNILGHSAHFQKVFGLLLLGSIMLKTLMKKK